MDRINESLKRVTGPAKELLLIIKKELEDVAEAFATGKPAGTGEEVNTTKSNTGCGCSSCTCHSKGKEETPTT